MSLKRSIEIPGGQTRVVPIQIRQASAMEGNVLSFIIYFRGSPTSIPVSVAFRNLTSWNAASREPIRATYVYAASHPSYFIAKPPFKARSAVPILALRESNLNLRLF